MTQNAPSDFNENQFIGRDKELDLYRQWLKDPNAHGILYFYDVDSDPEKKGGIGKTWLLQRCIEITRTEHPELAVVSVDFFHIADRNGQKIAERLYARLKQTYPAWSADSFAKALKEQPADLAQSRKILAQALRSDLQELDDYLDRTYPAMPYALVLVLDTFEVIRENPSVAVLSPSQTFPDNYGFRHIRFLIAGRYAINWEQPNWQGHEDEVQSVALEPFNIDETARYMQSWWIELAPDSPEAMALRDRTEGRPILLGLVKDIVGHNIKPLKDLVFKDIKKGKDPKKSLEAFKEYLVSQLSYLDIPPDEDGPIKWTLLFMAHAYHRFNTSLLQWMLECANLDFLVNVKDQMRLEALPHLSFVRRATDESGDFTLHDEMRSMIVKYCWHHIDGTKKEIRREVSRCVIRYYEKELEQEHDELARQTYIAQILYHKAFVNASDGLQYFTTYFPNAIDRWQGAYARLLLQQMWEFKQELSPYQRAGLLMAEARLDLKEGERETALGSFKQLLGEADRQWAKEHRAELLYNVGEGHLAMSQFSQASEQFNEALQILESTGDNQKLVAAILNSRGYMARRQGELDKAVSDYQKSIAIYKELSQQPKHRDELPELQRELADVYNNLSNVYKFLGEIDKALTCCQTGLQIRKRLARNGEGSGTAVGISHSTLASIYLYDSKIADAEKHFQSALNIFIPANNRSRLAECYNGFGLIQLRMDRLDDAILYFRKASENAAHVNEEAQITSLSRQGHALALRGEYEHARGFFEDAITLAESVGASYQVVQARMGQTRVLASLQEHALSSQELAQAITLATQHKYRRLLGTIEKLQGELAYQQKKYADAFEHYAKYCHTMAEYNAVEYRDARRFVIDELLNVEETSVAAQALDSLRAYWQGQQLATKFPDFLSACDHAGAVIL